MEHHAEGVEVGAPVDPGGVGELLRRGVGRRAEAGAGLRLEGAVRADLDQPEVPQARADAPPVALQQDVARLDVPVHHALLVGIVGAAGDGADQGEGLGAGRGIAGEDLPEGGAVDEGHQQGGRAADGEDAAHREEVGVAEAGLGRALCPESAAHLALRAGEDLEGVPGAEEAVADPPHLGHAADADALFDEVPSDQLARAEHHD